MKRGWRYIVGLIRVLQPEERLRIMAEMRRYCQTCGRVPKNCWCDSEPSGTADDNIPRDQGQHIRELIQASRLSPNEFAARFNEFKPNKALLTGGKP